MAASASLKKPRDRKQTGDEVKKECASILYQKEEESTFEQGSRNLGQSRKINGITAMDVCGENPLYRRSPRKWRELLAHKRETLSFSEQNGRRVSRRMGKQVGEKPLHHQSGSAGRGKASSTERGSTTERKIIASGRIHREGRKNELKELFELTGELCLVE